MSTELGLGLIADHIVGAAGQGLGRSARGNQRCRSSILRLHAGEIDALQIAAIVAGGLQTIERKLRRDVVRRDIAAARTRAPPLEQIVREELDVRADPLRADSLHGGRHLAAGSRARPRDPATPGRPTPLPRTLKPQHDHRRNLM